MLKNIRHISRLSFSKNLPIKSRVLSPKLPPVYLTSIKTARCEEEKQLSSLISYQRYHSGRPDQRENFDKSLPNVIYIERPWRYLRNRLDLLRFKLFWDRSFDENQFIRGATQAVVVLTEHVRNQNAMEIHQITTPLGFRQISLDMLLSKDDPRLQLLQFRFEDIKKAVPAKIYFLKLQGNKHVMIDMFFAGLRNVRDSTPQESAKMMKLVKKYDATMESESAPTGLSSENILPRRIVFAEILTRFYRDYSSKSSDHWFIAFYKVANFDVLALDK